MNPKTKIISRSRCRDLSTFQTPRRGNGKETACPTTGAHPGNPYPIESSKAPMAPIALITMAIGVILAKSQKNQVLFLLLKVIALLFLTR